MKSKNLTLKSNVICQAVLFLLLFAGLASVADPLAVQQSGSHASQTNHRPVNVITNQSPELSKVMAIPHLQPRKKPERASMSQERSPMQTHRHPIGPERGGIGMCGSRPNLDPRTAYPANRQQRIIEPARRNLPPSLVKKYDANKDGKLDSMEWYKCKQDMENRRAEMERLRAVPNIGPTPWISPADPPSVSEEKAQGTERP